MKQTHRPTHKHRRGFTIVELVIVIAVIGILATVLVPTFGDVINNAKDSAAKQEAKNAYTEYIADAAASGNVANYCVYEADANRFVAIANGAVVGVYETQDAALSAMVTNPTEALVDTGDGKLFAYGGEEEGNQTPVAPTVYSLFDEQVAAAMNTLPNSGYSNGVNPIMPSTSIMSNLSGKTVTKIAGMFKVTNNTQDCYFTVHIVSTDGKTNYGTLKIKVDGTQFENTSTGKWFEIDVTDYNIKLEAGQTLAFCAADDSDTVKVGYFFNNPSWTIGTVWKAGTNSAAVHNECTLQLNIYYVD